MPVGSRPLVSRSATRAEAVRLEKFLQEEDLEAEDLMSPPPDERITTATNLSPRDNRRFEEFARRRGVSRAVILRGLILGRLKLEEQGGGGS